MLPGLPEAVPKGMGTSRRDDAWHESSNPVWRA
jgi:hypothetical protein